jgi:hypothetical protein
MAALNVKMERPAKLVGQIFRSLMGSVIVRLGSGLIQSRTQMSVSTAAEAACHALMHQNVLPVMKWRTGQRFLMGTVIAPLGISKNGMAVRA